MSIIAVIIASAGMSLGFAGPEHSEHKGMEKGHGEMKEAAHSCSMCEGMAEDEKCAMCASHEMPEKTELPKVDSALYGNAQWPAHNKGESLYAKDFQGQALPVALGTETWITEKTNLEGKVLILDFWATWCPPCRSATPILDGMQKENKENLAVLAIGGQSEDEKTVREYLSDHKETIHNLFDSKQSVFRQFESEGIPLVVVMSTDGIIRWIGNPHDKNFKGAVEQVISVDPLIQAKS
jgi:thiol-disulfide isomerase/thioredoxin